MICRNRPARQACPAINWINDRNPGKIICDKLESFLTVRILPLRDPGIRSAFFLSIFAVIAVLAAQNSSKKEKEPDEEDRIHFIGRSRPADWL
jgi:hypothetical protein